MKNHISFYYKSICFIFLFTFIGINGKAEDELNFYANVNWQYNIPIENNFTNVASGWGMNLEGGCFIMPKIGVGIFLSYSSNHKHVVRHTIELNDNTSLTASQERSLFQLPFGLAIRYKLLKDNKIDPYFSMKLGPQYSRMSSFISTYKIFEKIWGFFISPEIGSNLFITEKFGLNVSLYYNFSTCKGKVLDGEIDNLSNIGLRLGLTF